MKKLIIANWKNYVNSPAQAEEILERVNDFLESLGETLEYGSTGKPKEFSLVFCPPAEFLESVGKILETSHFEHQAVLGAQDMAEDLKKKNARYVIIGHSDRRWPRNTTLTNRSAESGTIEAERKVKDDIRGGESDEVVNQKLKMALRDELIPIVCIGEKTRDPSTSSGQDFKDFLKEQTLKTFDGISADDLSKCIIAYEPVWAISTNPNARPDKPEDTLEAIAFIKNILNTKYGLLDIPRILYGGSVASQNVGDFLKHDEISGVLVGGASVDKEEFIKILSQIYEVDIKR